jgi:hypothetical protein
VWYVIISFAKECPAGHFPYKSVDCNIQIPIHSGSSPTPPDTRRSHGEQKRGRGKAGLYVLSRQ